MEMKQNAFSFSNLRTEEKKINMATEKSRTPIICTVFNAVGYSMLKTFFISVAKEPVKPLLINP